jgi:heme exporter protein B
MRDMWREAMLIVRKDLLLEWRSRVTVNQIAPLGLLSLVVFAMALDANQALLDQSAPGLFWIAVLFAGIITVQRSFTIEAENGIRDALRLSSIRPAAMFLGKATAITVQLLVLEAVLLVGVVAMYDATIEEPVLAISTAIAGTASFAVVGCIYGAVSLGLRVRETLLPLLLIPVVAPVLLGATRAMERAFGVSTQAGWNWVGLLVVITAVYTSIGLAVFGPLLEDG